MKLTGIILLAAVLHVTASGTSQTITFTGRNVPLKQVFAEIKRQTGYVVFYSKPLVNKAHSVSLSVNGMPLLSFLPLILQGQSLGFSVDQQTITIREESTPAEKVITVNRVELIPPLVITGWVLLENQQPLTGATIHVKGTKSATVTNEKGYFEITAEKGAVLVISYIGYEQQEIIAGGKPLTIILKQAVSVLDESVVIAYGTTTRRLSTGSVSKVDASEIEKQPINNPLAALAGKIPGMKVAQYDGLPQAGFDIVIRGKNSLAQGYRPLILLDGVPVSNATMTGFFPGAGGNSPLSIINPGDIESIDVLKDADATAIYGSRGSNGVILITSKRGKAGKTTLDINAYSGLTLSTTNIELLNTPQYLQMRREAFRNDKITPTKANAPDLLAWDTTRYTDWGELFQGKTANASNAQVSVSGGSSTTQFRIGAAYHHETPLYADFGTLIGKRFKYDKGSVQVSLNHRSTDNKLNLSFSSSYGLDKSNYTNSYSSSIFQAPNAPYPLDANNELVWSEGGVAYDNPLAGLYNIYNSNNKTLTSNMGLSYQLLKGLNAKLNMGYNTMRYQDESDYPMKALNPSQNRTNSSHLNDQSVSTWLVEPMLQFNRKIGPGMLELLIGQSWQGTYSDILDIQARNYTSDIFLGTTTEAATVTTTRRHSEYFYEGAFGKINYNIGNKIIANLTARRDGSSRFGPGKRYSNFGAGGLAYIFSEEPLVQQLLPFLSFGKLRANYGITGNDAIGDYQYFENWSSPGSSSIYDGHTGLEIYGIYNSDYSWEKNVKAEIALELGFAHDRILLSANYYRSRAGNQLVNYKLPSQTGNTSVLKNFEAVIRNTGWEWTLSAIPVKRPGFKWNISVNATTAGNKLIAFPNLASSTYANRFVIGKSIGITRYLPFTGVNSQTGLYSYAGTGTKDRTVLKESSVPSFYGGITNSFTYKGFSLDIFTQFVVQQQNAASSGLRSMPGTMSNQPVQVLSRWQQPGDQAPFQRFSTAGAASTAFSRLKQSDAYIVDGSFLRVKNIAVSYDLNRKLMQRAHIKSLRLYLQGQNLFLITGYKNGDPENGGIGNPLIRVFTAGLQLTL